MQGSNGPTGSRIQSSVHLAIWKAFLILTNRGEYGLFRKLTPTIAAKAIGFDVAFQEWFYEPRTVAGNLNPTVDGTYHAYVHLGTVSVKFMF